MQGMRRKEKEMPREHAIAVVDECAYSVMATVNSDGSPYCIPLSMAREGEWIYFHSAMEGHKINNIKRDNRVCISCVGHVAVIPGRFSLDFESVVINGKIFEITGKDEKIHALKIISQRYTPKHMPAFDEAIQKSLEVTSVWKIHIDEISGKGKKHQ